MMAKKLVHLRSNKLIEDYRLTEVLKMSSFHANKMSKVFLPEETVDETKIRKLPYTLSYIVKHSVTNDIFITQ
jgi:hypothetical protein